MAVDPSWLPSTAAQSSAALVAIVGGFLINRLVAIDAEQRQSERRLNEARDRCKAAVADEQTSRDEWVRLLARSWLVAGNAITVIVNSGGEAELAELKTKVDDYPTAVTDEEMAAKIAEVQQVVKDSFQTLSELVPDDEKQSRVGWDEFRTKAGWLARPWDEYRERVYDVVVRAKVARAKQLRRDKEGRDRAARGLVTPLARAFPVPIIEPMDLSFARRSALLTQASRAADQLSDARRRRLEAETEVRFAERASIRAERQPGVTATLAVLSVFAIIGILVPVLALTREHTDAAPMKSTVAWCFLVGVLLFLGFLWWYAVRLGQVTGPRKPKGQGHGS